MTVAESYDVLIGEEADKLLDDETVNRTAIQSVEENGIVFIDHLSRLKRNMAMKKLEKLRKAA